MHLEVEGEGQDLVLLHGWGLQLEVWDALTVRLRERWRVIRADLPGHGRSRNTAELNAEALIPALETVLAGSAHWVGWSLGGLLALQLSERRPEWFERLALVACNPCFVQRPDWPGVAPGVLEAFSTGLEEAPEATWKRFLGLTAQGGHQREVLRELRACAGGRMPAQAALAQGLALLAQEDVRGAAMRVSAPVHWLLAGADGLVPAAVADALALLTGPDTVTRIDAAGHAPFLSHSLAFNQWLDACLET